MKTIIRAAAIAALIISLAGCASSSKPSYPPAPARPGDVTVMVIDKIFPAVYVDVGGAITIIPTNKPVRISKAAADLLARSNVRFVRLQAQ